MVLTYGHSENRQWATLSILSFILLWACSTLNSGDELNAKEMSSLYVSSDLWLDNAKRLMSGIEGTADHREFMAEMSNERGILKITLDNNNEIHRVVQESAFGIERTYYFEKGKPAFSKVNLSAQLSVISAYADKKPYAHALEDGSVPEDGMIDAAMLSPNALSELIRIAEEFSLKEKTAAYDRRIDGFTNGISDSLRKDNEFLALINVIKGERLRIDLVSGEPHVYFTVSPNNGSDMEHKFWQGEAPITGDLAIRVFAAEVIKNGAFSLKVERH